MLGPTGRTHGTVKSGVNSVHYAVILGKVREGPGNVREGSQVREGSPIRADVNRQKSFRSQYVLHRVDSLRRGKSTLQRAIRVRELRGHLELRGHRAEGSVNSIDNCAHLHASGVSLDTEMKSTTLLLTPVPWWTARTR